MCVCVCVCVGCVWDVCMCVCVCVCVVCVWYVCVVCVCVCVVCVCGMCVCVCSLMHVYEGVVLDFLCASYIHATVTHTQSPSLLIET